MTIFGRELHPTGTAIPGLTVWELPVHGDDRGWFKENWQREKMVAAGLPDFGPVQNNISFNDEVGVTRGIHAEPWDKFVSVASGRIFGAWVDLREGPAFGTIVTAEIDAGRAVFVPRGVGNAYQTLVPGTTYSYLVNQHWSADASYTFVNLADPAVGIDWPIPLAQAVISDKDRNHPPLRDVRPMAPRKILVLGASGQVGRALQAEVAGDDRVEFATRADIDLAATDSADHIAQARQWSQYEAIINAAAYTAVDAAESASGRRTAWATNVTGVGMLTRICTDRRLTLVHFSSDYVFDGSLELPYREDDPPCPLGVYGQTKAAADALVAMAPRHYILRTSWVIGNGNNFVRTMARLARQGVNPAVVDDQFGRLTFTSDLAAAAQHVLTTRAPYGTYNVTGDGERASWFEVARAVFRAVGADPARVSPVSTEEYVARQAAKASAPGQGRGPGSSAESSYAVSPRPKNSTLNLSKINATGFQTRDWRTALDEYVKGLRS